MSGVTISLKENDLLAALPASLRSNVLALESAGADWNAVGQLLGGAPAIGVSLKGASDLFGRVWEAARDEFRLFLCTDVPCYSDLRASWAEYEKKGARFASQALAAAIGAKIGLAGAVVAPLAIWLLLVVARIGKNAVCTALLPQAATPTQQS